MLVNRLPIPNDLNGMPVMVIAGGGVRRGAARAGGGAGRPTLPGDIGPGQTVQRRTNWKQVRWLAGGRKGVGIWAENVWRGTASRVRRTGPPWRPGWRAATGSAATCPASG